MGLHDLFYPQAHVEVGLLDKILFDFTTSKTPEIYRVLHLLTMLAFGGQERRPGEVNAGPLRRGPSVPECQRMPRHVETWSRMLATDPEMLDFRIMARVSLRTLRARMG
jgi:hypothetical protein